ncbi:MAG TPA: ABC transporter permease, partial [Polyangiaceae bacterium]
TAWAKGLSERRVLFVHALRNGIIPIITLLGLTLPYLISGSVVVEQIFGIRGMGLVALEAIRLPDYPLVITVVAFTAVVTMLGILVSDVVYALVDPRIRIAGESDV